jgi:DNA-directed RNA polymerase subunit RPC12/RpoP
MSDINFPPPGYVPGPSKVQGIDIYLPASGSENHPEVMDFKCPKCGATTSYSVDAGKLHCEHCGYEETPEEKILGKGAEAFEFKVETLERSQQGWGEDRKEMACQDCGAQVSVPPDTLSYSCPFCGSNKVLYRAPLQDVLRPRYLVPFRVDPQECRAATQQWLGSSWMTPGELRNAASINKFNPIYLPYWTFDAMAKAGWKAQVGKEVRESYMLNGERHTRTKIIWRWESGMVEKFFDDLLVPGTVRLNLGALAKIDFYNLSELVLYEPRFLAGMQAQAYDVPLEQAWEAGRKVMRDQTRKACLDRASSSMVRDFSMNLDFSDESWRYILVPAYTSVYNYQGKIYQVILNGQTSKVAGPRPVDWTKVWLVIAALLAPGVLLGLLGLLTLILQIGVAIGALGLFLLVVGLGISFFIFRQAQEMENV